RDSECDPLDSLVGALGGHVPALTGMQIAPGHRLLYDRSGHMETLSASGHHGALRGRGEERRPVGGVLGGARPGQGRALVLRREAGAGKTALLQYLVDSASDLTVVRAMGVESEMELPYASLHQLCGLILDRLQPLPAPQRQALEIAFGLGSGSAPDRF